MRRMLVGSLALLVQSVVPALAVLVLPCWAAFGAVPQARPSREFLAVLIDAASQKPVPSARIILALKTDGKNECTIQTSLTAVSNERGEARIPDVAPGEYVVFYNLSGASNPGLEGRVVNYDTEGWHGLQEGPANFWAIRRSLGRLMAPRGAEMASFNGKMFVNGYIYSLDFDLAMISSKGDLLKVRVPGPAGSPVRIEVNTELAPEARNSSSPTESPMSSAPVSLPQSRAGHEPGETIDALGMIWQKAPPTERMKWEHAKAYCAGLTAGSWRLPTKDELVAFYKSPSYTSKPADGGWYWAGVGAHAWYVSDIGGMAYNDHPTDASFRVRCAR